MKIQTEPSWKKQIEETVTDYAERCLDSSDCASGQIEKVEYRSEKNSRAIGRLLDVLASKGLLTAPEITLIVEGYVSDDAKFIQ